MSVTELAMQIEQTKILIDSRPRMIALLRPNKRRTMSGGIAQTEDNPITLPPVRRYFGGMTAVDNAGMGRTATFAVSSLGNRFRSIHALIGMPGDDIKEDDFFYFRNNRYEVLFVDPETLQYQTKAVVVHFV